MSMRKTFPAGKQKCKNYAIFRLGKIFPINYFKLLPMVDDLKSTSANECPFEVVLALSCLASLGDFSRKKPCRWLYSVAAMKKR